VAPERSLGLLEHRAGVRFAVDEIAGAGAAHAIVPRVGDGGQRCRTDRRWPWPLQRRQEVEGFEQRARTGDTAEVECAQQRRQKTAHRRILIQDLLLVVVAGWACQGVDHGDRRVDGGLVMRSRDRQAHVGVVVPEIAHHARDVTQHECCRIKIVDRVQPTLLPGASRPLEQIVEEQIEEAERIVGRGGLQGARESQQRRDASLGCHLT